MIVLDTNVISEMWRPDPDQHVAAWLNQRRRSEVVITSTIASELLVGCALLPSGRRRRLLQSRIDVLLDELADRVLPFDLAAARHFGRLIPKARVAGVSVGRADAEIGAVAVAVGAVVATRDTAPFRAMGVDVVNPWDV